MNSQTATEQRTYSIVIENIRADWVADWFADQVREFARLRGFDLHGLSMERAGFGPIEWRFMETGKALWFTVNKNGVRVRLAGASPSFQLPHFEDFV